MNGTNQKGPGQAWTTEDSLDLYHVNAWGKGYFSINDAGHVIVRPDTLPGGQTIDLFEVVEGLKARRSYRAGGGAPLGYPGQPAAQPACGLRAGHRRERIRQ